MAITAKMAAPEGSMFQQTVEEFARRVESSIDYAIKTQHIAQGHRVVDVWAHELDGCSKEFRAAVVDEVRKRYEGWTLTFKCGWTTCWDLHIYLRKAAAGAPSAHSS